MSPIHESWQEVNDTLSQRVAGMFMIIMVPLIRINSFLPHLKTVGYNRYRLNGGQLGMMTHESFRVPIH